MKLLHRHNLYCWSQFDEDRNIDFHSYAWVTDGEAGSKDVVVIDPLPMSEHDKKHLGTLGKVNRILITNSDHVRAAEQLAKDTGAEIWGPVAEKDDFPIKCDHWLGEEKNAIEGLDSYALSGSKTGGELAFVIEKNTLITGDLIRAHSGGKLCMLPDAKLKHKTLAVEAVKRLANLKGIHAILPGDGWPVFRNGSKVLAELVSSL